MTSNIAARVLVPVADGSEEMEVVIIVDVLRRAGIDVVLAGLEGGAVTCSRGVRLQPDTDLDLVLAEAWDAIVVPGGGSGSERLAAHTGLRERLKEMVDQEKWVAAICAGPRVLAAAGLLSGQSFTCHPGVRSEMLGASDDRVVQSGRILTSQGPGTAMEFSLELVRVLLGDEKAESIARPLIL